MFHADFYRLGSEDELYDLGWDEILERFAEGLVLVEWADKFSDCWPNDVLRVNFQYGEDEAERKLDIRSRGPLSEKLRINLERVWAKS